ncbi:MAG: ATP synthase F0 subunit B [Deltaproteobacteria bacterium]|nr:ATP synthase F0 subunit B [Deltaproteobacteria bacterium]
MAASSAPAAAEAEPGRQQRTERAPVGGAGVVVEQPDAHGAAVALGPRPQRGEQRHAVVHRTDEQALLALEPAGPGDHVPHGGRGACERGPVEDVRQVALQGQRGAVDGVAVERCGHRAVDGVEVPVGTDRVGERAGGRLVATRGGDEFHTASYRARQWSSSAAPAAAPSARAHRIATKRRNEGRARGRRTLTRRGPSPTRLLDARPSVTDFVDDGDRLTRRAAEPDVELNATIFIQAVILIALMLWLSPMLFGPALRLFDERDKRIHGAAEETKRQLSSASEKSVVVEQRLQAAQAEARGVLAGLRDKAQQNERTLIETARADAGKRLDGARAELATATDEARKALEADAAAMADDIVKKILGRVA